MIKKFFAGAVGAALLAGYLLTADKGVSKMDKNIYKNALSLQSEVDEIGFPGFSLSDFPVAMYDGTSDYVFYEGEIHKRAPVLETFAGTAYPVDGHYEVVVPTLERLDGVLSLAGGVEGMTAGSGYGKTEQTATIWHEAFHAFQMSNFQIWGASGNPEKFVEEVDHMAEIKKEMEQEMQLLEDIVIGKDMEEGNIDEIKQAVLKYKQLAGERRKKMPDDIVAEEKRCELTEGTAYYVEANVFKAEKGNADYQKRYVETLSKFEGGRGKYYRTGMAKCLILDRLLPKWKAELDFTKPLDELLGEALKQAERE